VSGDFNVGRKSKLPAGYNVTGSASIGAPSKAPRHPKEKTILFLAQKDEKTMAKEASRIKQSCAGNISYENFTAGGQDLPGEILRLRSEGYIGDETHLVINFHGQKRAGDHFMGDGVRTLDVVEAIRKPLENGKTCSATVYIMSCYAGGQKLRRDMQAIHNKYSVGVCFLLSGTARSMSTTCSAAMDQVIAEVAQGEGRRASVPPMQIFARMGISRNDCMTMIEANKSTPLILHAPRKNADMGKAGLLGNIENGTVIISDKGAANRSAYVHLSENNDLHYSQGGDLDGERQEVRKKMVEGDDGSVGHLKNEVQEAKEVDDLSRVRQRTLDRRAMHGSCEEMVQFFIEDEELVAAAKEDEWDARHSRILDLFTYASLDESAFRRTQKMEYLTLQCSGAVSSIDQFEKGIIYNKLVRFPAALDALVDSGFFLPDDPYNEPRKMEAVCMPLMRGAANGAQIKSFLERNKYFQKELSEAEINWSHSLVIQMLQTVASGDNDRSMFLREYLVGLLSGKQELFDAPDNQGWIEVVNAEYPAAVKSLRDKGVFGPLPFQHDEAASSASTMPQAPADAADPVGISHEDRMNLAVILAGNASRNEVQEYLKGFNYWNEGFSRDEWNDCHELVMKMLEASISHGNTQVINYLLDILDPRTAFLNRDDVIEKLRLEFPKAHHYLDLSDFFR
jgi:hypothetical protein